MSFSPCETTPRLSWLASRCPPLPWSKPPASTTVPRPVARAFARRVDGYAAEMAIEDASDQPDTTSEHPDDDTVETAVRRSRTRPGRRATGRGRAECRDGGPPAVGLLGAAPPQPARAPATRPAARAPRPRAAGAAGAAAPLGSRGRACTVAAPPCGPHADGLRRQPQHPPPGAAHHRGEEAVAPHQLLAAAGGRGVPGGGGMVVGHDVGHVAQRPPRRREVEGEALLLPHEEDDVVEAADGQEGLSPHHRRAGHEAQDRRPRQVRDPCRAATTRGSGRSRPRPRPRPRGCARPPRRGGDTGRRPRPARASAPGAHHESSSAKATSGRARVLDADVAGQRTEVAAELDDLDLREVGADEVRCPVTRPVVHEDDRSAVVRQGPLQVGPAVARHDDRRHVHERAPGAAARCRPGLDGAGSPARGVAGSRARGEACGGVGGRIPWQRGPNGSARWQYR